jgi:hypothetical protein
VHFEVFGAVGRSRSNGLRVSTVPTIARGGSREKEGGRLSTERGRSAEDMPLRIGEPLLRVRLPTMLSRIRIGGRHLNACRPDSWPPVAFCRSADQGAVEHYIVIVRILDQIGGHAFPDPAFDPAPDLLTARSFASAGCASRMRGLRSQTASRDEQA